VSHGVGRSFEAEFLTHLALIERTTTFVAWRHGLFGAEAEDFASFVKEKLIENDYGVFRKFEHRAKLDTYLTIVIGNLCKDFRITASGKWRASARARRLGYVAVLLEQLLTREGHSVDEAWEIITTNHGVLVARGELELLAAKLPGRSIRRFVSDEALADMPAPGQPPDYVASEDERAAVAERAMHALRALTAELPSQDQLILALCSDGLSVAEIAATLGLDQKRLYRRRDGLYARLRRALEAQGVESCVLDWLEES
jgi:RNA polymerase sigma factor for flagellar operon FliA